MLKSFLTICLYSLSSLLIMISQSSAMSHPTLPDVSVQQQRDLEFYENKQTRCLDAFSRSEFEVAYAICTPLAKLGFKDAQLVTGLLYAYGEGVNKDMYRAKIWLKEALKNGRDDAAQALAEFGIQ